MISRHDVANCTSKPSACCAMTASSQKARRSLQVLWWAMRSRHTSAAAAAAGSRCTTRQARSSTPSPVSGHLRCWCGQLGRNWSGCQARAALLASSACAEFAGPALSLCTLWLLCAASQRSPHGCVKSSCADSATAALWVPEAALFRSCYQSNLCCLASVSDALRYQAGQQQPSSC